MASKMKLPSDILGLDKLSEALSEASKGEKCSICLENLGETVSLRPCTHLSSSDWLVSVGASASGKATHPAARRQGHHFEAQQKERDEILQSIVRAISLDLGIDITTYKREHPIVTTVNMEDYLSPVKKTTKRSLNKAKLKTDRVLRNRETRKSKSFKTGNAKNSKKPSIYSDVPTDVFEGGVRDKKVMEWLNASKFSQVSEGHIKETIVVDVYVPDSESTALSEEQLKSVTQVEPVDFHSIKTTVNHKRRVKTFKALCDLDEIRPYDEINVSKCSTPCGVNNGIETTSTPKADVFDDLLPVKKKGQLVKATYGGKLQSTLNLRNNRIFPVESDVFTAFIEPVNNQNTEREGEELVNPSQATLELEDFSSGSGEQWGDDLKKGEQSLQTKPNLKTLTHISDKCLESVVTRRSSRLSKCNSVTKKETKKKSPVFKFSKRKNYESPSSSITKKLEIAFPKKSCEKLVDKGSKEDKDEHGSDSIILPTEQDQECQNQLFNAVVTSTPTKQRSPGWSRLTRTRKEFHMSEKKKLSLRTLNCSVSHSMPDIKPLSAEDQSLLGSSKPILNKSLSSQHPSPRKENIPIGKANEEASLSYLNLDLKQGFDKKDSNPIIENVLNKSFASTTPFAGFSTPKPSKSCKYLEDVDLNQLPFKILNEEIVLNNSKNIEQDTLLNLPSVSSNQIQEFHPYVTTETDDKISMSHGSQVAEKIEPQNYIEEIKDLPKDKKRSRDPSVEDGDSLLFTGSPLRKRFCQDAQTQTSPAIHEITDVMLVDYLKNVLGIDKERFQELLAIHNKNTTKTNPKQLSQPVNFIQDHMTVIPQESDKEKNCIHLTNNMSEQFLNDSDIVFGTEDCAKPNFSVLEGIKIEKNEVDLDAVTQPYKTPLGPKKILQQDTGLIYSAVSNPTDSELKKVNNVFLEDELFLIETPKSLTPWNSSGVKELEDSYTIKINKDVDLIWHQPPQKIKEKYNKSRRQLDFIAEDFQSIDVFDTIVENEKNDLNKHDPPVETNATHNEEGDISVVYEHLSQKTKQITEPSVDNMTLNNYPLPNHSPQTAPIKLISKNDKVNICSESRPLVLSNQLQCNMQSKTDNLETCEEKLNEVKVNNNCDYLDNNNAEHKENKKNIIFQGNVLDARIPLRQLIEFMQKNSLKEQFVQNTKTSYETKMLDDDQLSNASSADYFIEGTPDTTAQLEMQPINNQSGNEQKKPTSFIKVEETKNIEMTDMAQEDVSLFCDDPEDELKIPAQQCNTEQSEVEESDNENYCFASSLLTPAQNRKLLQVLESFNIPFSRTVSADITHLVVSTSDRRTQNSYKFLYAMALHKTVISFDWVEQVMVNKVGETVALDPYFALDPSGECGVLRAKQDKKRILLHNFAVHVYSVNLVTKEEIEELVHLCGGKVVSTLSQFHTVPRDMFRVILFSETPDTSTQSKWRSQFKAVGVSIDWLYNTVGRYRVVPLPQFTPDEAEAVVFLQREGYPLDLMCDLFTVTQQ